jgi:3-oxoacid CoA-transferase
MARFFDTPAEAVADIPDGVSIAAYQWRLSATPVQLLFAIRDRGIKDITLIMPTFGPALSFPDEIPSPIILLPQLKKVITNVVGRRDRMATATDFLAQRVEGGGLELEVNGHGNWTLRLAAGAARLGGFYTPVGVDTELEEGAEVRVIDGQKYIFLTALRPDVGLVRAYKADKLGNLTYYGTERGAAPLVAQASRLTIAEVEQIVEVGELDPEEIVTPSIFVDRIVKIPEGAIGSRTQKRQVIAKLGQQERAREVYFAIPTSLGEEKAAKLAKKERLSTDVLVMRAARELKAGDFVNLGLGIPQMVASYVPAGVCFQCENGCLGYGPLVTSDEAHKADYGLIDAGGRFFSPAPGMSFFDMFTSFNMVRSGRIVSIVGALEVSEKGDLANHSLGKADRYSVIGGAMDVVWGAKRVVACMTHTTRDGRPKVLKECRLPLTAKGKVNLIITDIAVIEVTPGGLLLKEVAPGWTADEVQALTEARLTVAADLTEITL